MTPRQIGLARHALGLPNKRKEPYRNHFVAGVGHTDYQDWLEMVASGEAIRVKGNALTGGDDVFHLTLMGVWTALKGDEKLTKEIFVKIL